MASILGGAVHRRAAGGSEPGRAWEAGRARPNQEDNAAAPARRASGTSTRRPGATRGRAPGQLWPADEPVWPSWPARQQQLMRALARSVPLAAPQRSRPPGVGSSTQGALYLEHGAPSCARCKSLG